VNKQNCETREREIERELRHWQEVDTSRQTDNSALVIMIQTAANVKRSTLEDPFRAYKVEIINVILQREWN